MKLINATESLGPLWSVHILNCYQRWAFEAFEMDIFYSPSPCTLDIYVFLESTGLDMSPCSASCSSVTLGSVIALAKS